jgi:hypothetical protein
MTSQLNYLLAREQQAALAHRAERSRQGLDGEPPASNRRRRRPIRSLFAALSRGSEQRELPLAPRCVERAAVAAGCLEVE